MLRILEHRSYRLCNCVSSPINRIKAFTLRGTASVQYICNGGKCQPISFFFFPREVLFSLSSCLTVGAGQRMCLYVFALGNASQIY